MTARKSSVERHTECQHCGKILNGNQRKWCSRLCKTRAFNASGFHTVEYWREYNAKNKQRRNAQQRARWAQLSEEERHEACARRYRANAEDLRDRQRAWRSENLATKLEQNALRRVREATGADGAPLNRQAIYARDGWVCQLCGEPVDKNLGARHPRMASLDHIVPVSRGGSHTADNTQLAHLECNLRKGARIEAALGVYPGQGH